MCPIWDKKSAFFAQYSLKSSQTGRTKEHGCYVQSPPWRMELWMVVFYSIGRLTNPSVSIRRKMGKKGEKWGKLGGNFAQHAQRANVPS